MDQQPANKPNRLKSFFKELRRHPRVISIYIVSFIIFIAAGFGGGWYLRNQRVNELNTELSNVES